MAVHTYILAQSRRPELGGGLHTVVRCPSLSLSSYFYFLLLSYGYVCVAVSVAYLFFPLPYNPSSI